ncbi:unnamed protein product [Allacma fusca]|uniref:Uncharacterized protein n=1 Tax=Allacma fusca TaxID=39272 RepID=A0A8J2PLV6_9HEXA|nr:unnamed protein product [Allacma fusca]
MKRAARLFSDNCRKQPKERFKKRLEKGAMTNTSTPEFEFFSAISNVLLTFVTTSQFPCVSEATSINNSTLYGIKDANTY